MSGEPASDGAFRAEVRAIGTTDAVEVARLAKRPVGFADLPGDEARHPERPGAP